MIPKNYLLMAMGYCCGILILLIGAMVISNPPAGDEPQGYALVAISMFLLVMTYEMVRIRVGGEDPEHPVR